MMETSSASAILKKAQIVGVLERICQELELTNAQFEIAKARYEAVGKWLTSADGPLLQEAEIYPQGSVGLGTTVRPLYQQEYDVDLVSLHPNISPAVSPDWLKRVVGDRLRLNGQYRDILEEKPRCWRLNYANEFHLDITPSIPNPTCSRGGELVPEKERPEWKPSNPRGYRAWFEERASYEPQFNLAKAALSEIRAQVESLPEPTNFKGLLRRSVQLCKRHRDVWFSTRKPQLAPVSIVITTLAAQSYAHSVANFTYDTELDLFLDVVRQMPSFIERRKLGGEEHYFVWNETTSGENFAEKWNLEPRLAQAFLTWQSSAIVDFEGLVALTGLDQIGKNLSLSLGERPVNKALRAATLAIGSARAGGRLSAIPRVGLSMGKSPGVAVRANTFFGR